MGKRTAVWMLKAAEDTFYGDGKYQNWMRKDICRGGLRQEVWRLKDNESFHMDTLHEGV